jgi:hypothetical protein
VRNAAAVADEQQSVDIENRATIVLALNPRQQRGESMAAPFEAALGITAADTKL